MHNLNFVFEQALLDDYSGTLDSKGVESRLLLTIKITRDNDSGVVEILNTAKGGEYYEVISDIEYELFLEKGWRYGVYVLYLSNCRSKLSIVDTTINEHMQDKSKTLIETLHKRRLSILNNYTKVKLKLNQLHNEQEHLH
tara:strand:- start:616 stop:1035 length:420 start_codon:yes stop_codon:yes gene_type:complete